jgi:F-type H+-transporting ATPase subunit b
MLIDWFTVVAQAINFLILVWLLKRFLFKPILGAIDEREKGIAAQLAQAEAKQAEAQKEREDFQHKSEAFDQQRAALMKKAADDAQTEHQRLLDAARKDADALRAKRQEALRNEQRNLSQEIIRWTQQEVFAITRKTLADLATASLEQRLAEVFVQRLRALAGTAKQQLAAALKTSTQPAVVRSAFDLPPAERSEIESAIKEITAVNTQVQFQTAPEVVSGIELSCGGQKVSWSIADYLATLEKSADELLHEEAKPASTCDAKPKAAQASAAPGVAASPDTNGASKPEQTPEAKPDAKVAARAEPKNDSKHEPAPSAVKANH